MQDMAKAKKQVSVILFGSSKKIVHEDIIRKMKQRSTSLQIDDWISKGDLANLLNSIVQVMIVGGASRVHESIREKWVMWILFWTRSGRNQRKTWQLS
jgi:hypothetical protein